MHKYEQYLPLLLVALTVLLLGCWNPPCLQQKDHGLPNGKPNYVLVALLSFAVGVLGHLLLYPKHGLGHHSSRSHSPRR